MPVIALACAIFLAWWAIGFAFLTLMRIGRAGFDRSLLAPVFGLALLVLPLFWLNRFLPISSVGTLLAVLAIGASIIVLIVKRREASVLRGLWTWPVCLIALILVSWPAFYAGGHDWVSSENEDMANYIIAASYRFHDSWPVALSSESAVAGTDYPRLFYWFLNADFISRPGSELMMAAVMANSGVQAHQAFSPTILAQHMVLVCSVGALAGLRREWQVAALAMGLASLAPLIALGTVLGLLGQVGGLALLCAAAALLFRPLGRDEQGVPRLAIAFAIIASALMVWYSEIAPILALAYGAYLVTCLVQRLAWIRTTASFLGIVAITGIVLLNDYLPAAFHYVLRQAGYDRASRVNAIFPQYLIPSGLPGFWGLLNIDNPGPEPWLSLTIGLGIVVFVFVFALLIRLILRNDGIAYLGAVLVSVGLGVAAGRDAFGLFKLAMFAQPVFVVLIARWADRSWHGRRYPALVVILLVGIWLPVQQAYVARGTSSYETLPALTEQLPARSSAASTAAFLEPGGRLLSDVPDSYYAKLQSVQLRRWPTSFASRDFFTPVGEIYGPCSTIEGNLAARSAYQQSIWRAVCSVEPVEQFAFTDSDGVAQTAIFRSLLYGSTYESSRHCDAYIESAPNTALLNAAQHDPSAARGPFTLKSCNELKNHLTLVDSSLSRLYRRAYDGKNIAVYRSEPDPLLGGTMAGLGRFQLYEVFHPTDEMHVVIDVSASLLHDGKNLLPPARIIGEGTVSMPVAGRGSARVVSPAVRPRRLGDRWYFLIDMGRAGRPFAERRHGLMGLYGADVRRDPRDVVSFTRDTSTIGGDDLVSWEAPSQVTAVASDIRNPRLLYSGIYEDGWASDHAYVMLRQPASVTTLTVAGEIPVIDSVDFQTVGRLLLDGEVIAEARLGVGAFQITGPVSPSSAIRRVELQFDSVQSLPGSDGRPVVAQLRTIGFASTDVASWNFRFGHGWYPFEQFGGESFRWAGGEAELTLSTDQKASDTLEIEVAPGPGADPSTFSIALVDQTGAVLGRSRVVERQNLKFTVANSGEAQTLVRLRPEGVKSGPASASDPRQLDFRVFRIAWAQPADIAGANITLGPGWHEYETFAGESFRWVGGEAELSISPAAQTQQTIELEAAPGPGMDASTLALALVNEQGIVLGRQPLTQRGVMTFPLPQSAGITQTVRLRAEGVRSGQAAPGDARQLDFRVFSIRSRVAP